MCAVQGGEVPVVQCMRMRWEAPAPDLHPDIILGADLIYDPGGCPPLCLVDEGSVKC